MSPKRIALLLTPLMFLALGAGLKASPNRWSACEEHATRMGAFVPMIPVSTAQDGSGDYATVYDCTDQSLPPNQNH